MKLYVYYYNLLQYFCESCYYLINTYAYYSLQKLYVRRGAVGGGKPQNKSQKRRRETTFISGFGVFLLLVFLMEERLVSRGIQVSLSERIRYGWDFTFMLMLCSMSRNEILVQRSYAGWFGTVRTVPAFPLLFPLWALAFGLWD